MIIKWILKGVELKWWYKLKMIIWGWEIIEYGYLICSGDLRYVFLKELKESGLKVLISFNLVKNRVR